MLRVAAASTLGLSRRSALRFSRGGTIAPSLGGVGFPYFDPQERQQFHASAKRDEEAKAVALEAPKPVSYWHDIYYIPLGVTFAIPALKYEWIILNTELQLAAVMVMFTMIVYKEFGGIIQEALEADGKKLLAEHNQLEDEIIEILEEKLIDLTFNEDIVKDAEDILALKIQTYEKLNAVGIMKPKYDLKAQVERMLAMIETEEVAMKEKFKMSLMAEATDAVTAAFAVNKDLQKNSLSLAISQLKASSGGAAAKGMQADPVKDAYLNFFKEKKVAKVDEDKEALLARENLITKLNAVASNEGFYFTFGPDGKPTMAA